jgi:hypothetical protein
MGKGMMGKGMMGGEFDPCESEKKSFVNTRTSKTNNRIIATQSTHQRNDGQRRQRRQGRKRKR